MSSAGRRPTGEVVADTPAPASDAETPRTSGRWPQRTAYGGATAGLFSIYLLTSSLPRGSRPNVDTFSALVPAWSLGQRGTLNIPEYLGSSPWIQEHGDLVLSDRMPGIILWATPFYALLGSRSGPSVGVAALAAVTAATLAVLVLHQVFRRVLEPTAALVAAGLAAFGTATWTVSADALWPHGMDQLWIAIALIALSSERYWATGLAYAAGIMTRPHLAACAAVCGLWEAASRRTPIPALVIGATSSLGVAGLVAYNYLAFGQVTLLAGVYAERPNTATNSVGAADQDYGLHLATQVAGTFLSPLRGVLVLSPFLLLLLPGLRAAWRAAPPWIRSSAVAAVVYMSIQLLGNGFQGGSYFYSYRLSIEMLTLAAPLLALAWREWTSRGRARQIAFAVLASVSVLQHAIGAFIFSDTIDFRTRAWSRYQPLEGLRQAGVAELVALGVVAAVCIICSYVLISRRVDLSVATGQPT